MFVKKFLVVAGALLTALTAQAQHGTNDSTSSGNNSATGAMAPAVLQGKKAKKRSLEWSATADAKVYSVKKDKNGDVVSFTDPTTGAEYSRATGKVINGVKAKDWNVRANENGINSVLIDSDNFLVALDGKRYGSVYVPSEGASGCFLASTLVATEKGFTPIASLVRWQRVLTGCDETAPRLNMQCSAPISQVITHQSEELRVMILKKTDGSVEKFVTTDAHPIYLTSKKVTTYAEAGKIPLGEKLSFAGSSSDPAELVASFTVKALSQYGPEFSPWLTQSEFNQLHKEFAASGLATVYTLDVVKDNTFFVKAFFQANGGALLVHEYMTMAQDIPGGTSTDLAARCYH